MLVTTALVERPLFNVLIHFQLSVRVVLRLRAELPVIVFSKLLDLDHVLELGVDSEILRLH